MDIILSEKIKSRNEHYNVLPMNTENSMDKQVSIEGKKNETRKTFVLKKKLKQIIEMPGKFY